MNFRLRWAIKSTGCGDEFMSALLLTHQAKTSKNQEGLTLFVSNELINNCGRTQSSEGLIEHFNYYFKHVIVSTWMKFAIISAIVLRFLLPSTLVHVGRVWIFPDVQRWRDKTPTFSNKKFSQYFLLDPRRLWINLLISTQIK